MTLHIKYLLSSFLNPYSHTNINFYKSSPCSALIRVSDHGLVDATHISVANLACAHFSIIRTYYTATSSVQLQPYINPRNFARGLKFTTSSKAVFKKRCGHISTPPVSQRGVHSDN